MQITVQKEPQLLGFSNGKPLVGGVDGTIFARPIICFSIDAMEVGDYPYVLLLKHPWPPPVLLHLPLAGAGLQKIQWPSFCCYGADKKSKLLIFRDCRLQRLGGKPHFKGRGMSATWANTRHGPDMYITASGQDGKLTRSIKEGRQWRMGIEQLSEVYCCLPPQIALSLLLPPAPSRILG